MAKFRRFEGAFSWFFIELEILSVERDICLIATAQRPNCSYNKGYISYFYCACAKRLYFHFRSKIWRYHRIGRRKFGDSAINNGYRLLCIFYCTCVKRSYFRFRFEVVFSSFFHRKAKKVRHISTCGLFGLLTQKACHMLSHHVDHFHQVWVDTSIHRRVTALLVRIRYVTFWPWPWPLTFWL